MIDRIIIIMAFSLALFTSSFTVAEEGIIHFEGTVQGESCDLSLNGSGTGTATVKLPDISKNSLAAPGDTAGATALSISLKHCSVGIFVRPFFESANVNSIRGTLVNTTTAADGGARNVEIVVFNDQGTHINLNTNLETDNPFRETDSQGNATFSYSVEYLATGHASSGKITTALLYNIIYK